MSTLHDAAQNSELARALLGLPRADGNNSNLCAFIDEGDLDTLNGARAIAVLGGTSFAGRSCLRQGKATHFEDLTPSQLLALLGYVFEETGVQLDELGSRLGKVKIIGDGTLNVRGTVMPKAKYFDYAKRVIDLAGAVNADKRVRRPDSVPLALRMFDGYPGDGLTIEHCFGEATDITGQTLALADAAGLIAGIETEAGLMGQSAVNMLRMHGQLGDRYRVVLDLGNLDSLGFGDDGAVEQAEKLLGIAAPWWHIKAHLGQPGCRPGDHIDEAAIRRFGPPHLDAAHLKFVPLLARAIPSILKRAGLNPGQHRSTFEPHYLAGGQFGGYSWLAGLGAAFRSGQYVLTISGIGYALTQYEDLRPDNLTLVRSC